jgi:hypothetical protein
VDGTVGNQHRLELKDGVKNEEVGELLLEQFCAYNGMGGLLVWRV